MKKKINLNKYIYIVYKKRSISRILIHIGNNIRMQIMMSWIIRMIVKQRCWIIRRTGCVNTRRSQIVAKWRQDSRCSCIHIDIIITHLTSAIMSHTRACTAWISRIRIMTLAWFGWMIVIINVTRRIWMVVQIWNTIVVYRCIIVIAKIMTIGI